MRGINQANGDMWADEQNEVIAFLSQAGTIARSGNEPGAAMTDPVERHDTHGAHVFLAGDTAIKIKRAVRYPYLDFSTLDKRKAALARELEINRANAPDLYREVGSITRGPDGGLQLGGDGEVVEWFLAMRRFEQSALLSQVAKRGLDASTLKALADEVHRSHAAAPVIRDAKPDVAVAHLIDDLLQGLAQVLQDEPSIRQFGIRAHETLERSRPLLLRRAAAGKVRRCHGDLHLDNIVLVAGLPTLFDALEFDEGLASIDTLYDIAFLLMDLDIRATRTEANAVLNRYLWRTQDTLDLDGLALLPLFLALRAGVRGMVLMQRSILPDATEPAAINAEGRRYLEAAAHYLDPPPAVLIAVGGFSGTGKSTLASALAPRYGAAPGALHLRSDLERKALHGVAELERLSADAYTREESARVYATLCRKARAALDAGHSVIVDAVFAEGGERHAVEEVARDAKSAFAGIWLDARREILDERVAARRGDASDATAEIVEKQARRGAGDVGWASVDASAGPNDTRRRAQCVIDGTFSGREGRPDAC